MKKLESWFLDEARDLPWRQNRTPYAVWVSEVMLQQTQVSVVIPYFLRWMEKFPTLKALANAPIEEVIKCWEGLGYYSRARNLHAGAKKILESFNGVFPDTKEALATIKGLGPYTIGAILSFAFQKKCAAVDGNVIRVLSRVYKIEEEVESQATLKKIWDYAESLLPDENPWMINEALIELGAKVCQKKPLCHRCPLRDECLAYRHQVADLLPKKKKKMVAEKLLRHVFVLQTKKYTLLRRGKRGK